MNIVFDLDGTLINSKLRLYKLFQQLTPDSRLSYDEYWHFKENRVTNETILANQFSYGKDAIALFVREWMSLIEAPEFLILDTNFPGMCDTLTRLREQAQLYVCTARQSRRPVLEQLERLGLLQFFSHVLVTEQQSSKEELLKRRVQGRSTQDWMLGDTGKDIQTGKMLQMNTCAVLSGFMNKSSLLEYEPGLILDSAVEFTLQCK